MRVKREAVFQYEWAKRPDPSELALVSDYREKYKEVSRILDENPRVLDLAHRDLRALSEGGPKGRRADFTSENLLRALLVHQIEGEDFRGTVIRLAESRFLQDFLRLGNQAVMDFTFLNRAFKLVRPETWKAMNEALALRAREQKRIDPSAVRTDTTVVEATIHYPTDASLLWDGWRVLARLLRLGRDAAPGLCPHRFHDGKVRKLSLRIARYRRSKTTQRRRFVRTSFATLIERTRRIRGVAETFVTQARKLGGVAARGIAEAIAPLLPIVATIVSTSERANLKGETVPASERVFSVFEPHTELIRRGKSAKPVEFGHAVLLTQTREKFITDFDVMEHRKSDHELAATVVDNHEALFGEPPEALAADTGFNPKPEARRALEGKVKTLAIPRKVAEWLGVIAAGFHRFRAGIEGSISVLKRAYRLIRCPYRGFKSFAASIGMAVFCHNLVLLARPPAD